MAKQQFVRCWYENHVWQKFLFEMGGCLQVDIRAQLPYSKVFRETPFVPVSMIASCPPLLL